jgi:hypothetical protein
MVGLSKASYLLRTRQVVGFMPAFVLQTEATLQRYHHAESPVEPIGENIVRYLSPRCAGFAGSHL